MSPCTWLVGFTGPPPPLSVSGIQPRGIWGDRHLQKGGSKWQGVLEANIDSIFKVTYSFTAQLLESLPYVQTG